MDGARALALSVKAPILPDAVLGVLILILTEIMMFAGLISAMSIVGAQSALWPPLGQPRLPVEATAVNTVILLASGALVWIAARRFADSGERARAPLLGALLTGLAFVLLQGTEWAALLRQGVGLTTSTHSAFFYLIVGMHALHACAGLVVLSILYRRLRGGALATTTFWAGRLYWYFVVGLWPVLYWQVYL